MGKPTSSCFQILTCGAAEDAEEDVAVADPEKTSLSDNRRWSFRNRSSRHRVLSNSVISESLSVNSSKEVQEATATNCYLPISSSIPEKPYVQEPEKTYVQEPKKTNIQEPEKPLKQESLNDAHPASEDSIGACVVTEKNSAANGDELSGSTAVINQAASRGYMVHSELEKLQHLIKLQAAVRGHLVRRQAVGTFRCIHAIMKMQMLIRARYALKSVQVPFNSGSRKQRASINRKETFSTQKLLSSGFARQLLEATPKTKSINITSDSSKADSIWLWLERWTAISSHNMQTVQEEVILEKVEELIQSALEAPSDSSDQVVASVSSTINTAQADSSKTAEGGGGLTPKSIGACEMKGSLNMDNGGQSLPSNITGMKECNSENVLEGTADALTVQTYPESNLTLESIHSAEKPECDRNPKHYDKRVTNELSDTEGKKFPFASRKAGNPAFVAAQSKFEELTSAQVAGKSTKHTYRDVLNGSEVDKMLKIADSSLNDKNCQMDSSSKNYELSLGDSHYRKDQMATSDCGNEISISSLDSQERSESEGREVVLEIGYFEKGKYDDNSNPNITINLHNWNYESKDLLHEPEVRLEKLENSTSKLMQEASNGIAFIPSGHTGKPTAPQLHNFSPDASPGSHVTAPESHGTPSSEISINGNKNKKKNDVPAQKQKSQVVVKRSPLNPNNDSGGRSSTEHLPNDTKSTKRQKSLAITKPDQVDHAPRTSTSSSLPSYMQDTESARAKVRVSVSPKESSDVCDKDNDSKKRHSLPIANVKQGVSPRMQRSTSQAEQNSKGDVVHSPQTYERRWQR